MRLADRFSSQCEEMQPLGPSSPQLRPQACTGVPAAKVPGMIAQRGFAELAARTPAVALQMFEEALEAAQEACVDSEAVTSQASWDELRADRI